jgi:hypothetical protein
MTKLLKYSVLALALTLGSSTYAHAECVTLAKGGFVGFVDEIWNWLFHSSSGHNQNSQNSTPPKDSRVTPEVDPNLALSAFLLLGGTLTVLCSRRSSRPASN